MRCGAALASALVAALLVGSAPLLAAQALEQPPTMLDASKAYVLVRIGERGPKGLLGTLMLSPYDAEAQDIRGRGRAKGNPLPPKADDKVVIGPGKALAAADHVATYLVALTPGRYVVSNSPTTCFCLGSYQFEAEAGKVTDLGLIYIGPENGTSPWAVLARLRSSPDIEDLGYTVADAMAIYPWKEGMSVPASIAALPRQAANYRPALRFGNHHGKLVNRAMPLGGGQ